MLPNETYYVENIKSTNFILGTNTKSTNLRIHEPVNFNQTTKIDTHKEKYFHSNYHMKKPCQKVYTLCINLNLFCLYKVPVLVVFLGLAAVVCWFEELDVCCWYWVGCWFWVSWLGAVFGRVLVLMVKNIIWFK